MDDAANVHRKVAVVHETAAIRIAQELDDIDEADATQWQAGEEPSDETAEPESPLIRSGKNEVVQPLSNVLILFICVFFSMSVGVIVSGGVFD
jgi:hypothetical protein